MLTSLELLEKIAATPTPWHAVENVKKALEEKGFSHLPAWESASFGAGNYYVTRNGSALMAVRIPAGLDPEKASLRITAAHGDSPCLRVKPDGATQGKYPRLNTELYGGSIHAVWMDTPLSLAGRVMVRTEAGLGPKLIFSKNPVAVIPNTAPHLRPMNDGLVLDPKCDLIPLCATGDLKELITDILKESGEDADKDAVAGWDLSLVIPEKGQIVGSAEDGFLVSPRLDDLECVYTCLEGFLEAESPENVISVFALFDNEETGSLSYAGAAGTFLKDVLARVLPDEALRQAAFARSFFVSADNAHGLHPNRPELSDSQNAPLLNGGVVVKYNAAQRYMSDGFSGAVFAEICRRANVPVQTFANRADKRGGSTLGNLSEAQVPMRGVDIGLAQLAMHSARETAGCKDADFMVRAVKAFYSAEFTLSDEGLNWK